MPRVYNALIVLLAACLYVFSEHDIFASAQLDLPLKSLRTAVDPLAAIGKPSDIFGIAATPLAQASEIIGNVPVIGAPFKALRDATQLQLDSALYQVAQDNMKKWNDALQSKDYDKVASLYSTPELSFLPSASDESAPLTKQFFTDFLKKHPVGTVTSDKVQSFGESAYLHSGVYTVQGVDGKPVDTRFAIMWRKLGSAWKIVHYHSSLLPGSKAVQDQQSRDEAIYPLAQDNFKRWNDALQTKDYKQVAALYSTSDVSFLPTVSADFIRDSPSTQAYFIEFLKKLPVGTITADKVQSFGDNAYLHSGMYTFMVGPEDSRSAVEARFSYMWRLIDNAWKIVHHHSSKRPPK